MAAQTGARRSLHSSRVRSLPFEDEGHTSELGPARQWSDFRAGRGDSDAEPWAVQVGDTHHLIPGEIGP